MSFQPNHPAELFLSYSHKDEELRDQLKTHLVMLQRAGVIGAWHDRRVSAGREWAGEIAIQMARADIILFLVSPDFLASDYCFDIEMVHALKRHFAGEAIVIPIILRPCDWEGTPFGRLQAMPERALPVTLWPDRDEAFFSVAKRLREIVERTRQLKTGRTSKAQPTRRSSISPSPTSATIKQTKTVASLSSRTGVFISYSRKDKRWLEKVQTVLTPSNERCQSLFGMTQR